MPGSEEQRVLVGETIQNVAIYTRNTPDMLIHVNNMCCQLNTLMRTSGKSLFFRKSYLLIRVTS